MADIDIKIKAQELGLALYSLAESLEGEFNQSIADIAHGAHARIIAEAQEKLHSTRQDYLKGLSFEKIGKNEYLISLDGDFANALEKGWAPYDMRTSLLKSKKTVSVGSRAGLPWVQLSKKGKKFAHVPLEKKPTNSGGATDLASAMRNIKIENAAGKKQRITQIFKDINGNPMEGKVAVARGLTADIGAGFKDLEALTKYQRVYKNEQTGKERVESTYISYRTISENGSGWMNKGNDGLKAFEQTEQWIDKQIEAILKYYLE